MTYIVAYWYLWVIGLIVFPLIAVLPQVGNIRKAIEDNGQHPEEIGKLFVSPPAIIVSIVGGMGTFICLALFVFSLILGLVDYIKA